MEFKDGIKDLIVCNQCGVVFIADWRTIVEGNDCFLYKCPVCKTHHLHGS